MSISKDLKAIFSKNYLSTSESDEILLDLKSELSNSNNLNLIMEELSSYTYKGKMQRVMRDAFERISTQGDAIEDVFLTYGIIEHEEYIILKRALSTSGGIDSILAFRGEGNQFLVFLRKVFLPFLLFVFFGIFSFVITTPILKKFLEDEVAGLVKEKRNYDVVFQLPSFMENESYIYITIVLYILIFSILIYTYNYLRKTRIDKLYKFSYLSFYDDFVKYFTIASMMKKGGANSDQVFEDLSFQAIQGLRPMFNEMFIKGSDYYEQLMIMNSPYRIYSKMRRNEENSKFWENLDDTVEYVKVLRKGKVEFYVKYFASTLFLFGFVFLLFCLALPVIYLLINIYTFAT